MIHIHRSACTPPPRAAGPHGARPALLKFINSFGFFVALAFVAASWTLGLELRRKAAQGLLKTTTRTVTIGRRPRPGTDRPGLLGFVLGWKRLYLLLHFSEATADAGASC